MISSGRAAEIGYWSILAQPFYIKIAVKDHPHLASTREKVAIASSQMKRDQNVSELYSKNLSSGRELFQVLYKFPGHTYKFTGRYVVDFFPMTTYASSVLSGNFPVRAEWARIRLAWTFLSTKRFEHCKSLQNEIFRWMQPLLQQRLPWLVCVEIIVRHFRSADTPSSRESRWG